MVENGKRTALILIGGRSSRANFFPKYLFRYNDETFLDRQVRILRTVCDEIIVSCRDEQQSHQIDDLQVDIRVTDSLKEQGPVEGIRKGALAAHGDHIFIVACDMPFIIPSVITYLFELTQVADAIIPGYNDGKLEPLHAVYRRDALIRYFDGYSSRRLREISRVLHTLIVPVDELRTFDPKLRSFININDLQSFHDLELFTEE